MKKIMTVLCLGSLVLVACPTSTDNDAGSPDVATTSDAGALDVVTIADAGALDVVTTADAGSLDVVTTADSGASDVVTTSDAGASDVATTADARRDQCEGDAGCASGICTALPAADAATRFCVNEPDLWQHACEDGGLSMNACCQDLDCPATEDGGLAGQCMANEIGYCGGAAPQPVNVCRYPDCQSDEDCGSDQACLPPGAFGHSQATCVDAECRSDDDCQERAGGSCRPLSTGTCGLVGGFFCTYADDPCQTDSDCHGGLYPQLCLPDSDGGTHCVDNPPMP